MDGPDWVLLWPCCKATPLHNRATATAMAARNTPREDPFVVVLFLMSFLLLQRT